MKQLATALRSYCLQIMILYFSETISQHIAEHKSWEGILSFAKTNGKRNMVCLSLFYRSMMSTIGIAGYIIISRRIIPNGESIHTRQDISKEEIILSEQKWRSLLDNTRGAIFLIDTNYQIILVNEKGQKILDHSTACFRLCQARPCIFLTYYPKNDRNP